jgi:hypothetical protein
VSAASRWSYTSKATYWPKIGFDDWTRQVTYGAPVVIDCDYSEESLRLTDADGVEFTTRQIIFTEASAIKQGDMLAIGVSELASPAAAGASEVRAIMRNADTFDQLADDYKVMTGSSASTSRS